MEKRTITGLIILVNLILLTAFTGTMIGIRNPFIGIVVMGIGINLLLIGLVRLIETGSLWGRTHVSDGKTDGN